MSQQLAANAQREELNPFKIAQRQFETAADYLELDESTRQVLKNAKRQLVVSIPVRLDGGEVTARGCLYTVREACRVRGITLRGARVAIHGFGNAGANFARLVSAEDGARVVAIADSRAGVYNEHGIGVQSALRHKAGAGTIEATPNTTPIPRDEVLEVECDILLPAALENSITLSNVERVRAAIVAELANGPVT